MVGGETYHELNSYEDHQLYVVIHLLYVVIHIYVFAVATMWIYKLKNKLNHLES